MANIREEYNFTMNPVVAGQVAKGTRRHFTWSSYLGGAMILIGFIVGIWAIISMESLPPWGRILFIIACAAIIIGGIALLMKLPVYWETPPESWEEINLTEHEDVDENP